jgi:hypothetical protein
MFDWQKRKYNKKKLWSNIRITICAHLRRLIMRAISCQCLMVLVSSLFLSTGSADECHLTPVFHVLKYPGCIPKPIPSFACTGKCTSYVQVSGSKLWQTERSCMCCQESGEREATVQLFCPNAPSDQPKYRKLVTRAPADCMCRPCTAVDETSVIPSELSGYADAANMITNYGSMSFKK